MGDQEIKDQVRYFYDQVGWQITSEGMYQNARYEDLRPVAWEYIHRCHQRVKQHLKPRGKYLLDAGSGPVQYPDYLTYSQEYAYRVCADISFVALQEARKRLNSHGLYVVADVANLPFAKDAFEGIVSLHTLHHLPLAEQQKSYNEIGRVLSPGCSAVVVNGWTESPLMRFFLPLMRLAEKTGKWIAGKRSNRPSPPPAQNGSKPQPSGTYIEKMNPAWLKRVLPQTGLAYEIRVWRSLSVRFQRALILRPLGGKLLLKLIFWLEERFPRYFGEKGQYPLVILRKPNAPGASR